MTKKTTKTPENQPEETKPMEGIDLSALSHEELQRIANHLAERCSATIDNNNQFVLEFSRTFQVSETVTELFEAWCARQDAISERSNAELMRIVSGRPEEATIN